MRMGTGSKDRRCVVLGMAKGGDGSGNSAVDPLGVALARAVITSGIDELTHWEVCC